MRACEVRREHAVLEPLDVGQPVAVDFVEAAQVAGERVRFAVDALAAEVLEQVVVRVNAVERRVRRMRLVEVPEQIVDEMWKGFGSDHRFYEVSADEPASGSSDPPMVQ